MLCPLFIGEIASPETRGALVALEQLSIVLGVVLGFWVGFSTRSLPGAVSWRLPLGIQVFPGVVLACGSMLLPESPRMLVLRGEEKEAAVSLERLRNRVGSNDPLVQVSGVFGTSSSRATSMAAGTRRDAARGYPCQGVKRARRE